MFILLIIFLFTTNFISIKLKTNDCISCNNNIEYQPIYFNSNDLIEVKETYENTLLDVDFKDLLLDAPEHFDLLDNLPWNGLYNERNQGSAENCWVWAGTGVMESELIRNTGIKDRISIQYFDSTYLGGKKNEWAGCGGNLFKFVNFYNDDSTYGGKHIAIPWSNTNAYYQDYYKKCSDGTAISYSNISTEPNYPFDNINLISIPTTDVGKKNAINNIKGYLLQGKAVSFGFWLPNKNLWNKFCDFWNNSYESEIVDLSKYFSNGTYWDDGVGHFVLCVGYDETDINNPYWIMLNSWGINKKRSNGIFYLSMNIDYGHYYYKNNSKYYSFLWQTLEVPFKETLAKTYLNEFEFDNISDQFVGKTFNITIKAKDQYGNLYKDFNDSIKLSVNLGRIYPEETSKFNNGVLSDFPVTIYEQNENITIIAKYLDITSKSNQFNVYALPPYQPTLIYELKNNSIYLKWTKPEEGSYPINGYLLYKKIGDNEWFLLKNFDINTLEYLDSDIKSGLIYSYYIQAFDSQNNFSEKSNIINIFIKDIMPPILEITYPPNNNFITNNQNLIITGKTFDYETEIKKLLINNVETNLNDKGEFSYNINLIEGENNIIIVSFDIEDNETKKEIKVIFDQTPPQINIDLPNETSESSIIITGSVIDNISGVKDFKINNISIPISSDNEFSYSLELFEGNNKIIIEAEDNAQNKIIKEFQIIRVVKKTIMVFQLNNEIMYINNNPLKMEVYPQIIQNRTYLPIRYILEPIGANVVWDGDEKKVTITFKEIKIELWIGKNLAKVNGNYKLIDPDNPKVVPLIINGRTMLPVRFVAENLGCKVEWDPFYQSITITYPNI